MDTAEICEPVYTNNGDCWDYDDSDGGCKTVDAGAMHATFEPTAPDGRRLTLREAAEICNCEVWNWYQTRKDPWDDASRIDPLDGDNDPKTDPADNLIWYWDEQPVSKPCYNSWYQLSSHQSPSDAPTKLEYHDAIQKSMCDGGTIPSANTPCFDGTDDYYTEFSTRLVCHRANSDDRKRDFSRWRWKSNVTHNGKRIVELLPQ